MLTLANRRRKYDMVETFKIMHRISNVESKTWFTRANEKSNRNTRLTADHLNITKPSANSNMRKNFYSLRIVNDWNKLPTDTKEAPSLEVFKNTVNEILFAEQNNSVD